MSENKDRILMAIDPTEPDLRPSASSLAWFKGWAESQQASIEIVYVDALKSNHPDVTEESLRRYVDSLVLGNKVKVHILKESMASQRKLALPLLHYASEQKSNLIVVSSHGRSDMGRLVFGSFAESLLAASSIPVLFLSEKGWHPRQLQKILLPTDLSPRSITAISEFLSHLQGYKGEIVLYHAVLQPGAVYDSILFSVPCFLPESYWKEQKQWTDRESERLLAMVRSKGFAARMEIQEGILYPADAIRQCAKTEDVDLIVMASVSKGIDSAVVGSVTRELFRERKWPVWVYGPNVPFSNPLETSSQSVKMVIKG